MFLSAASDMRAEMSTTCAEWLTADDVSKALGLELETSDPVEYSPGFTLCSWTKDRPEGQIGANFSFFTMEAIRDGMISAESIPQYFDMHVSSHRDTTGVEPEKLEGIGKRAVLFTEDHLWIVMIELETGFGHLSLSPGDITRQQVEAVAKQVRRHDPE
jgi:hypothetical protein